MMKAMDEIALVLKASSTTQKQGFLFSDEYQSSNSSSAEQIGVRNSLWI